MSKKPIRKDMISSPLPCTPETWAWMATQMQQAMQAQVSTSGIPDAEPAKKNHKLSESEETSSDDDFLPEKKSKATPESKKRGRPTKAQVEQRRKSSAQSSTSCAATTAPPFSAATTVNALKVMKYPKPFDESLLKIAYGQEGECPACQSYVGSVILKPCGHASFCMKCINKLRSQACKNRRPAMCLDKECYSLVRSWFVMKNIHLKPEPEPLL